MIKYFVIRNFRGTCSSVEMLKGYMVTERLGIPDLDPILVPHVEYDIFETLFHVSFSFPSTENLRGIRLFYFETQSNSK